MSLEQKEHANKKIEPSTEIDYLIFSSDMQLFAIPYYQLLQIIDAPEHTQIPNSEEYIRGFLNFMGEAIPLYDMRKRIGRISLPDAMDDLVKLMQQQKREYIAWVEKLKHAVYNNEVINVEMDHTLCSFGQWYYSFHTGNNVIANYLSHFDKPHQSIHAIAARADKLLQENNQQQAVSLLKEAEEKELKEIIELFNRFEASIRGSIFEYAIVIENDEHKAAITADELKFFEKFDEVVQELPFTMEQDESNMIDAIGRKKIDAGFQEVLILNIDELMSDRHHLNSLINDSTETLEP